MFKIKNKTPILVTSNSLPISAAKIKSAFEGVTDADIDIITDNEVAVVRFGDVIITKASADFAVLAMDVKNRGGDPLRLQATAHYPRACLGNMLNILYE